MTKLAQTFEEDFTFFVSEYDERETLQTMGFSNQDKETVLEYNPYPQEGWDD